MWGNEHPGGGSPLWVFYPDRVERRRLSCVGVFCLFCFFPIFFLCLLSFKMQLMLVLFVQDQFKVKFKVKVILSD